MTRGGTLGEIFGTTRVCVCVCICVKKNFGNVVRNSVNKRKKNCFFFFYIITSIINLFSQLVLYLASSIYIYTYIKLLNVRYFQHNKNYLSINTNNTGFDRFHTHAHRVRGIIFSNISLADRTHTHTQLPQCAHRKNYRFVPTHAVKLSHKKKKQT